MRGGNEYCSRVGDAGTARIRDQAEIVSAERRRKQLHHPVGPRMFVELAQSDRL